MVGGVMKLTEKEWRDLGEKLFGTKDMMVWKFKCPSCGVSIKGQEWVDASTKGMCGETVRSRAEYPICDDCAEDQAMAEQERIFADYHGGEVVTLGQQNLEAKRLKDSLR